MVLMSIILKNVYFIKQLDEKTFYFIINSEFFRRFYWLRGKLPCRVAYYKRNGFTLQEMNRLDEIDILINELLYKAPQDEDFLWLLCEPEDTSDGCQSQEESSSLAFTSCCGLFSLPKFLLTEIPFRCAVRS